MAIDKRHVLLVQLPIPPPGPGPIRGNVPLAAGYLKLFARSRGLDEHYEIDIFPPSLANRLGDEGLVEAILGSPTLAGRLHLLPVEHRAHALDRRPAEGAATRDADHPRRSGDHGRQRLGAGRPGRRLRRHRRRRADLRRTAAGAPRPARAAKPRSTACTSAQTPLRRLRFRHRRNSPPRRPLARLDEISSPYLAGILDAADEQMLLLETIRGCVFKCKFCYYPKSYDSLYFLSREKIVANLRACPPARRARKSCCSTRRSTSGEDFRRVPAPAGGAQSRAGSSPTSASCGPRASRRRSPGCCDEANFTEVEIGLQSIDPAAQELMDRKNNLRAFERGVQRHAGRGHRR